MREPMTASAEGAESAQEQERGYWLYVPGEGAGKWEEFRTAGIMALNWDRIGDPTSYPNEEAVIEALEAGYGDWGGRPTGAAGMIRDFTHTMRPGDVVYARRGPTEIIGRGVVRSEFRYDDARPTYRCVRDIEWTHVGSWPLDRRVGAVTLQRVTENTSYNPAQLESLFRDRNAPPSSTISALATSPQNAHEPSDIADIYTRENFLAEVFVGPEDLEQMLGLLRRKKNLILQGAPGTGKTFAAKRLAYALMGRVDDSREEVVQFHQSTAYEDVVVGLRTDIVLTGPERTLIIDTKCYGRILGSRYDRRILSPANRNQIYSYVMHEASDPRQSGREVDGMLLYAQTAVDPPIRETWTETGHRFHVRTLDLDRDFTEIAAQLDDVAALLAPT